MITGLSEVAARNTAVFLLPPKDRKDAYCLMSNLLLSPERVKLNKLDA